MARLTEQQKEQVRQLRESGMGYKKIAAQVGCSHKTVGNILNPEACAEYLAANKERTAATKKRYADANRGKVRASKKAYRESNKEKVSAQTKAWYDANREKVAARSKRRLEKNRSEVAAYMRKRRRDDPQYQVISRMRSRMNAVLGQHKAGKAVRSTEVLGVTVSEWIALQPAEMIEAMMNGEAVHVDEIRPCSSFDLTDPEQQACCFGWRNRQLLLAADNLSKGAKWDRSEWEAMMTTKGWTGKLF